MLRTLNSLYARDVTQCGGSSYLMTNKPLGPLLHLVKLATSPTHFTPFQAPSLPKKVSESSTIRFLQSYRRLFSEGSSTST